MINKRIFVVASAALTALAIAPSNVFATALPINDSGVLTIANHTGDLVGVTTVPLCINWAGGATCPGTLTTTTMDVSGSSNLFAVGGPATIADETAIDGSGTYFNPFETVTGAGALAGQTIFFNITSIPVNTGGNVGVCTGSGANASLNTCTPAGSPFTLAESLSGNQVTITFDTQMEAYTGTLGSGFTNYQGIFQTTLSGTITGTGGCQGLTANIQNILSCEGAGGTITSSWSATESPISGVPEPTTLGLFGLGLVFTGLVNRRRRA